MGDPTDFKRADFAERGRFVCALAQRLHQYGSAAPRLESAVQAVAQRLELVCNVWCNPTGIILSFAERGPGGEEELARVTQVLRLEPGADDLRRLAEADSIAEDVRAGRMGIADGTRALLALRVRRGIGRRLSGVVAYGVASGAVAALLQASWAELGVAALTGTVIGLLSVLTHRRPQLAVGFEALAALVAALIAVVWGATIEPIDEVTVMVASVIVLLPGLALTTAINELVNQHLVSGVARLAGAGAVLFKLAFGTAIGIEIADLLGFELSGARTPPVPDWAQWLALFVASLNFSILFKAAPRDVGLVAGSAVLGYLTTRLAGAHFSSEFGVFAGGLVVGALANAYARWRNRPGALVRVPGIILLVPGSVGFRSLFFVFEGDVTRGLDTAFALIVLLVSLVAGLLFANVVVAPRKTLS